MNRKLYIDIETYSGLDLRATNVYRYSADPEFQILMAAWSTDGAHVQIALGEDEIARIPGLFDPDVLHIAHNAAFERVCLSRLAGLDEGEYLPPEGWLDTMAIAAELGYPRSLGKLATALGAEEKDEAGTRLINLFCKPNRKGQRTLPEDKPTEWLDFVAYCEQDVYTLIDIEQRLGAWPTESERQVWCADQRVNDRGIQVDTEMVRAAIEAADDNRMVHELELTTLTNYAVMNPASNVQLLRWAQDSGLPVSDLKADTIKGLLARTDLTPTQRRVLELRKELALVASKKYIAARDGVGSDGRLRGSFQFFGAHTGRWAGRGVQLQNLPRAGFEHEVDALLAIEGLKAGAGADSETLKALVRSMFVGPFTVVDYSAIEARVVAWLAGEQWALDAFGAGRDIYVETAERMGGLTRSQGKVAVLALGYQGGINSLRVMGADGNDQQLEFLVQQWRKANRNIVRLWKRMDAAFRTGGEVGPHLTVERDGSDRLLRLPSGRAICYRDVKTGDRSSFVTGQGFRQDTYGGRLVENATQAVARDLLAAALVRMEGRGFRVVGHVHDEILVEGGTLESVTAAMTENPAWAVGLPVDGAGYSCQRYRKE